MSIFQRTLECGQKPLTCLRNLDTFETFDRLSKPLTPFGTRGTLSPLPWGASPYPVPPRLEDEIITDMTIEGMQAILLLKVILQKQYVEIDEKDAKGKTTVIVKSDLFHRYFSFAYAVTMLVNDVTQDMRPAQCTDVAVVRKLLWAKIREQMGGVSETLESQWLTLTSFLDNMVCRQLPTYDWSGPRIADGVTELFRPIIEPLALLNDLYLILYFFDEFEDEDQEMIRVYGTTVLKSLDPTGKMMSKVELSEEGMKDYSRIYAVHHLPNVPVAKKDESQGDVVANYKEWKPVQLMKAILHDFAAKKERKQCEELVNELHSVLNGKVLYCTYCTYYSYCTFAEFYSTSRSFTPFPEFLHSHSPLSDISQASVLNSHSRSFTPLSTSKPHILFASCFLPSPTPIPH